MQQARDGEMRRSEMELVYVCGNEKEKGKRKDV